MKYGVFEGYPARWTIREAFVCWRGEWKSFPPMEVMFNAHVVTEAEYHELFGHNMTIPTPLKYGEFKGCPARWNDHEAWVYWRGEWKSFPPMEVWSNARVVTEAEHHELFRNDPPDPTGSPQRLEEGPAATPSSMAALFEKLPDHVRVSQRHGVAIGVVGYPRK